MYKINLINGEDCQYSQIGFLPGVSATNIEYIQFLEAHLSEMIEYGCFGSSLLKITGAASMPIASVLTDLLRPFYGAIACYDPKIEVVNDEGERQIGAYLVCASHGSSYRRGDAILG